MRLRFLILSIASISLASRAAQETSTATAAGVSDSKPAEPRGPLIEITPLNGGVSTAYLLAMKDGLMDIESTAGELKQEKTSEIKSIRFIAPAPQPDKIKTPPPNSTPTNTNTNTNTAPTQPHELTPTELKKREDHRHYVELLRKERLGTKLTPEEEKELADFQDKIPGLRFLGGAAFVKQAHNAESDAKLESSRGKLDGYITQQRQLLKDVATDQDARIHILRLACAYKQENIHFVKLIEQLDKDIDQIVKEPLRKVAHAQLQNLLDVLYVINGEKPPR
jgi:hypothetical protein